jgi:hypothetical protein
MHPGDPYWAQRKCPRQTGPGSILEGDGMEINIAQSPYAFLRIIPLKNVALKDEFWSGRQSNALSCVGCLFFMLVVSLLTISGLGSDHHTL